MDAELNEQDKVIMNTLNKALARLEEYGIKNESNKGQQPNLSNPNWHYTIKFSIPEVSTLNETLGGIYNMSSQEGMIGAFKDIYMRGITEFVKSNNPSPSFYSDISNRFKFLCRVRKDEIWTNRDKSKVKVVNTIGGVYD